ncbi:MAG TPA: FkbM family methyltransferase [Candidatus Acidoferrum sp.]|nr:FkbM family methyltransferase [Candidatus Acidoferrum sp.]
MKVGALSALKRCLVPAGVQARRVPFGLYRGIVLELDLKDRTQLFLGLWERETYRWMRTAARRCEWMIDVGAGRGELCLFFLKHSRACPVVAIEPQASERELMRRNLALNGHESNDALIWVDKLIGCDDGSEFLPLDKLPVDFTRPGFIKIDVDGAEMEVLRSGEALFTHAPIDLLVETHSLQLEQECLSFLENLGLVCRIIPNAWWRSIIPEHRPIGHNRWLWATRFKGRKAMTCHQ